MAEGREYCPKFRERVQRLAIRADGIGWGYGDALREQNGKLSPLRQKHDHPISPPAGRQGEPQAGHRRSQQTAASFEAAGMVRVFPAIGSGPGPVGIPPLARRGSPLKFPSMSLKP